MATDGVVVWLEGSSIRFDAPDHVYDRVVNALGRHKAQVIEFLSAEQDYEFNERVGIIMSDGVDEIAAMRIARQQLNNRRILPTLPAEHREAILMAESVLGVHPHIEDEQ
jgi:hypothetical protein